MQVTLYTNNCPKCKVIKTKLEQKNIKFTEETNIDKLVSIGYKTLPVLKVDEEFMDFKDAYEWIKDRSNKNEH